MKKMFLFLIMINLFVLNAQNEKFSIGAGLGIGTFQGNFPSQTTFNTKVLFETHSPISLFDKLNFNFTFGQKIEKFLPESYSYEHYSYFTSFGISGTFTQYISHNLFVDEGIGLIYFNDRSFSDIDKWNIGMLLNLSGGTIISKNIALSLSMDYGLTFTNTNSSYIAFLAICTYSF